MRARGDIMNFLPAETAAEFISLDQNSITKMVERICMQHSTYTEIPDINQYVLIEIIKNWTKIYPWMKEPKKLNVRMFEICRTLAYNSVKRYPIK